MKDFILFESKDGSVKVFGKRPARETTISPDEGILVIAPGDEAGLSAAIRIRERFEKIGVKAKILNDPSSDVLTNNALPSIVLGNLANSRCTEYLYYKHLVFTDLSYPGEEGYNTAGETELYSLDEYNLRFDKKVDKAYLEGRYGGIPNFSTVFPAKEDNHEDS